MKTKSLLKFFVISFSFFCFYNAQASNWNKLAPGSNVRILLFKDGSMSGLAHNHVMVFENLNVAVKLDEKDISNSAVQVNANLQSIQVDPNQYRKLEGSEFESELSEDDKEEIREEMLSDEFLDKEKFPNVSLTSSSVSGALPNLTVDFELSVHGVTRRYSVPFKVEKMGNQLTIQGQFSAKQTDFGVIPLSMMFGAIKVKNEFTIKVDLKLESNETN